MNLLKKLTLLAVCGTCVTINAQDDQNKLAEKSGSGPYMSYVITQSGNEYTYAGINKDPWQIEVNAFKDDMKEIAIKKTVNSRYFFPDNGAYAATFVDGWKENRKEMQGMTYIRFKEDKRFVFAGDWVYVLENWKDKDNYVIVDCLKKGELSGFKLTKAAFGAKKEMEKADHKVNLQKFLDEAFKKQAEVMATDEGKNKDQAYKDEMAKAKKRYNLVVDSINGNYWKSEEGQRILARNKEKEKKDKETTAPGGQAGWMIIKNTGGKTLNVITDMGTSSNIPAGSTGKWPCSADIYYCSKDSHNTWNIKGALIAKGKENCGQVVNIKND